jgi:hypothetical protein
MNLTRIIGLSYESAGLYLKFELHMFALKSFKHGSNVATLYYI